MMHLSRSLTPLTTPDTNSVTRRAFMEASEADYGYAEVQDVTQRAGRDNIHDQAESFWGGKPLDIPSNEPATLHDVKSDHAFARNQFIAIVRSVARCCFRFSYAHDLC